MVTPSAGDRRISLRGLQADDYLTAGPALGAALAALMRPGTGGKVELKYAIFSRLRRDDLSPGARSTLLNVIETYLPLDEREQAEFAGRLAPEGDVTMETLEQTWFDRMIAEGIEQDAPWTERLVQRGIERGVAQGKRDLLLRLVRARFDSVPAGFADRLATLDEPALDSASERLLQVGTVEELLTGL